MNIKEMPWPDPDATYSPSYMNNSSPTFVHDINTCDPAACAGDEERHIEDGKSP